MYTRILIFSNSLLLSALICYWKSKVGNISSYIEIIGITGGLIKIATCFNNLTGKTSLFFIKKFIIIRIAAQESFNELDEIENEDTGYTDL